MVKQKHNPLVSVIIPTFNRGWIIAEAVESVLSQDFSDFELIVVDDGSTDNTREVLEPYLKDVIFIQQPNRGVSAARNCGISHAGGRLVAFLDSDDIWMPGKITRQVAFFKSNSEALVCQTQEIWNRNGKRVNPKNRHEKREGMIFRESLELCLISPSAVMMRKKLFNTIGVFDETLPACEDYDMWLRLLYRYPVYLISEPLIIKRGGHNDQLSRTHSLDKFRIQSLRKIIKEEPLSISQLSAAMRMLKRKCEIYSHGCLKHGKKTEALYYRKIADRIDTDPGDPR